MMGLYPGRMSAETPLAQAPPKVRSAWASRARYTLSNLGHYPLSRPSIGRRMTEKDSAPRWVSQTDRLLSLDSYRGMGFDIEVFDCSGIASASHFEICDELVLDMSNREQPHAHRCGSIAVSLHLDDATVSISDGRLAWIVSGPPDVDIRHFKAVFSTQTYSG